MPRAPDRPDGSRATFNPGALLATGAGALAALGTPLGPVESVAWFALAAAAVALRTGRGGPLWSGAAARRTAVIALLLVPLDVAAGSGDLVRSFAHMIAIVQLSVIGGPLGPAETHRLVLLGATQMGVASCLRSDPGLLAWVAAFAIAAATGLHRTSTRDAAAPRAPHRFGRPAVLAALALASATVLFLVFPRAGPAGPAAGPAPDAPYWIGRAQGSGNVPGRTGYSDRVLLGIPGTLQRDPAVAFACRFEGEGLDGRIPGQRLWRVRHLDHFDGFLWTASSGGAPTPRGPHLGAGVRLRDGSADTRQIVRPGPGHPPSVPIHGTPLSVHVNHVAVEGTEIRLRGAIPDEYSVDLTRIPWETLPPGSVIPGVPGRPPADLLRVPPLPSRDRILELAARLTAGTEDPAERIRRCTAHFANGYAYTLDLDWDPGDDPLGRFLFETRRGHCEYFASGLAMLLRAAGVPCRLAVGYADGTWDAREHLYVVRQAHAHAWVEIPVARIGGREAGAWVHLPADATPAGPRGAIADDPPGLPAWERWTRGARDAWDRYVVRYDARSQERAAGWIRGRLGAVPPWGWVALAASACAPWALPRALRVLRSRIRPAPAAPPGTGDPLRHEAAACYLRAIRVLARRGIPRARHETPREFESRARDLLSRPAAAALSFLTRAHETVLYAGAPAPGPHDALRRALDQLADRR